MPPKKQNDGADYIKNFLSSSIVNLIKETVREGFHKFQEALFKTEEILLANIYYTLMMFCGSLFIALSCVFLLREYGVLSFGWSFMFIGLALLVMSLLAKRSIDNRKLYMRGE